MQTVKLPQTARSWNCFTQAPGFLIFARGLGLQLPPKIGDHTASALRLCDVAETSKNDRPDRRPHSTNLK